MTTASTPFPDTRWLPGADASIPAELAAVDHSNERPRYDSVVIRGNGIGALTLAGRLARSRSFAGKVVMAAAPPVENRRLINGCTLRSRSIDYYAAAFGTSRHQVLETIFGPGYGETETRGQRVTYFHEQPDRSFRLGPASGLFSDSRSWSGLPLSYGVRNGRLVGALHELLKPLPVTWMPDAPATLEGLRKIAPGSNPLVINAAHTPIEGAPPRPKPKHFVLGVQLPFTGSRRRQVGFLKDNESMLGARRREGALDTSVFYPFRDRLNPEADFYGIFYRVVTPGPGFDRDREWGVLEHCLRGVAAAAGMEPVAPEETFGTAMVPCFSIRNGRQRHAPGYMDFEIVYGAGIPIITGCGMSRAGLGGFVTAAAILAGVDPIAAANRALFRWRILNLVFGLGLTKLSFATGPLLKVVPGLTVKAINDYRNFWAGVPEAPGAVAS